MNDSYFLKTLLCIFFVLPIFLGSSKADTVTGNGYVLQQSISPLQGVLSGNGYILQQSSQEVGDIFSQGGFSLYSSLGFSTTSSSTSSLPSTPTSTPPSSSSVTISGGYYILPVTPTYNQGTTTIDTVPPKSTNIASSTILTTNGSTCSSRVTFSAPIDIRLQNNKDDVKKLEHFLNVYEGENLPINGIYEPRDVEAVKRWQAKYRSFVLDPMRLKNPTGTVYTLSQRQIERQTTKNCGQAIIVTACPFFKTNLSYGDKGEEVKKIQQFLNIVQGETLPLSGVFGPLTKNAVKRFQKSRRVYVATFIPFSIATGNWYATTRIKANETIGCDILK